MKYLIKYLFVLILILPAYSQSIEQTVTLTTTCMSWQDTILIQSDEFLFTLVFGGQSDASDDFDLGIDYPSAPPSMTYFACFPLPVFPGQLQTDIRKWVEPYDQAREWSVSVLNAIGKKTLMKWKVNDLPTTGEFTLIGLKEPIKMHLQDTVTFMDNKELKIQYQIPSAVQSGNSPKFLLPDDFSLFQNYPNPFNSITTIGFYLKKSGECELKIFNLIGNTVTVLYQGLQSAGYSTIQWDGRNQQGQMVASGVYFYQLKTDGQILTRKLILLP